MPPLQYQRLVSFTGTFIRICTFWMILAGLVFGCPSRAGAESFYDHHVFFGNSPAGRAYYFSTGEVVAPSSLELVNGQFPLDTTHFLIPPSSLRLKWKSAPGGDWRMKLKNIRIYDRRHAFEGNALSFWCYSEQEISPEQSPWISVQDTLGIGAANIPLLAITGRLLARKWTRIQIPFDRFKPLYGRTEDLTFDPAHLETIWLMQGLEDDKEHKLFIDDVQIISTDQVNADPSDPPAAPTGLQVNGAERHFDLHWNASTETNLLRYRIYRSVNGQQFVLVGVQKANLSRYEDFFGAPGQKAYYRVTAEDAFGHESPPSLAVAASTHKFTDDELLDMVQEGCFRYYWEGGHPVSGMAVEVTPGDENLVAVGASGFGLMALIVGAERHFITREQCAERVLKIVRFLRAADRYHGAWSHFLNGATGRTIPYFGKYDDGGDLVETAFMMQGLLAARQYFDHDTDTEGEIRRTITELWRGVEWDWYRKTTSSDFLYWHWSPDFGWYISHPLVGWNETMIVYLLAAASPTHPVPASLFQRGWEGQSDAAVMYRHLWSRTTVGDHYTNGNTYYGIKLDVGEGTGADLFFTQFSFMGFDPRGKRDAYTDYFINNRNIALINHAYCTRNPRRFKGYGANCWGLSAGINSGGGRPQPRDDNGTICCSAALGSFPYTPRESLEALKHFYRDLGPKIWGIYGFHDGFNETEGWFEPVWMGLNQAVITVMIENFRTGVIWKNFMANPEIQPALKEMGFKSDRNQESRTNSWVVLGISDEAQNKSKSR